MRPLALVIEGFTCFKDRQPTIDFRSLDLFAIAGPTGAGKTSILDAAIFALYGRVPRVGKSYGELISLGRDRMSVVLDFEVGPRRFRVSRVGRRGRSGEAQLEEIVDGRAKPLTSGVHDVDDEIETLLGLHYDAFTQAVVLPQGEFARFLKSQPHERREILRDLLRLQVYERMRKAANEKARELRTATEGVERLLETEYRDKTPEALEELGAQLAEQKKANRSVAKKLTESEKGLEETRRLHGKARELARHRTRWGELARLETEVSHSEARLAAAKKAAPLAPLLDSADAASRRSSSDQERTDSATREEEKALAAHEESIRRLEAANLEALNIPELENRIRALDEVRGISTARASTERRLEEARKAQKRLREERDALEADEKKVRREVANLERLLEEATAQAERLGYDEHLERSLTSVRDLASDLTRTRKDSERARGEVDSACLRLTEVETELAQAESSAKSAQERLEGLRRKTEEAENAIRLAERQHAADHLRRHLEAGKKCPVCEQPVKHLPPPAQVALLDVVRSRFEATKKAEEEARSFREEQDRVVAQLQSERSAAEGHLAETRRRFEEIETAAIRLEEDLISKVGPQVPSEGGGRIEERAQSALQRIEEIRVRYAGAIREQQDSERSLLEARGRLERLGAELEGRAEQLSALSRRMEEDEKEFAELNRRVAELTDAADPAAAREDAANRLKDIQSRLTQARESERTQAMGAASASQRAAQAREVARQSAQEAAEAEKRLRLALQKAEFRDGEAARKALLPAEEQQALEDQISGFRQERHTIQSIVQELEKGLQGVEVSDASLEAAEAEVSELRKAHQNGLEKKAALQQQVQSLEKQVQRAAELRKENEVLSRDHGIYRRLADDLRGERFQAYLLEESFRELVAGASERLLKLSGRYALEYRNDSFRVLDHDNAGEARSADTLSGGETFLASLALALELSEQIQKASGAVNLDSLFIDEGFGTLDPETLETVAAAVESLPVGGRMVGIITHIPELTERLPAHIWVEKTAEGSRLRQDQA